MKKQTVVRIDANIMSSNDKVFTCEMDTHFEYNYRFLEVCNLTDEENFTAQISLNLDDMGNEVFVNLTKQETKTLINILKSFL